MVQSLDHLNMVEQHPLLLSIDHQRKKPIESFNRKKFNCSKYYHFILGRLLLTLLLIQLFKNDLTKLINIQSNGLMALGDWDSWWTYEGISGPDFWGRLNPKWSHCSKGKKQSPIDIDTELLIYDPSLKEINIKGDQIEGNLINTGRSIVVQIDQTKPILISDGPFSYQYTLSNVSLHFGRENNRGSEHTIDQIQFAGELQFYGYNGQLYANWSEAKHSPNGLIAIAVLIKMNKNIAMNTQLKQLIQSLKNITNRGDIQQLDQLNLKDLLPETKQYVTYEGSLTQPACFETVQWVILNKPLLISAHQLHQLRTMLKSDGHQDNFRPIQELNHRTVRTNIVNHRLIADDQRRFKYDFDEKEMVTSNDVYSKQLCYVNQPIAYRTNHKRINIT